jgi:transcriptional regulator of heat shock response
VDKVLNPRLAELLRTSVEQYIKSSVPIASAMLAKRHDNDFSSATIRNDLKILEQLGYLKQVHTSGGRFPTALGYGAYIDAEDNVTFVADLINDLNVLVHMVDRISHKLNGSGAFPITVPRYDQILKRRQNIYQLLETPDLDISAFYLIIKERLDGRK